MGMRPRLVLDVSNLTAHYHRFIRTGIQEVIYQTLLATVQLREEFSDIEIVLMPFLPRQGMLNGKNTTLIPYPDTPFSVLKEIEDSMSLRSEELWGAPIAYSERERILLLSSATWIHFQGLINIGPLAAFIQCESINLSMTVYDLIPVLFPEYTPPGIAAWFQKYYLPSLSAHVKKAVGISYCTARDLRENAISQSIPEIYALPLPFDSMPTSSLDFSILKRLSVAEGAYLVYIGSLEPRKNLPAIIDGLECYIQKFPESDLKIVWVGSTGWKNDWILRKLERSNVKNRIVRPGYLSDQDLDQLIRLSGGIIMLSQYEGFGLPVAQGFSRGVPIITNYSSSLPEACLGDAIFCDPSSPDAVAQAITRSFWAPVSRFRKNAVQQWNWLSYTRDLIKVIIGETPRRARLI